MMTNDDDVRRTLIRERMKAEETFAPRVAAFIAGTAYASALLGANLDDNIEDILERALEYNQDITGSQS